MDESSETSSAKDVPTGSLHTSLLELRRLTQNLLDGNESTVTNNYIQLMHIVMVMLWCTHFLPQTKQC